MWLLTAAAIFGVGALTDWLDGYLARKWNAVTTFGRIMDPFADKFRSAYDELDPVTREKIEALHIFLCNVLGAANVPPTEDKS